MVSLLCPTFGFLQDLFRNPDSEFFVKELYISKDEMSITDVLTEVNTACKDRVIIGSYPEFGSRLVVQDLLLFHLLW